MPVSSGESGSASGSFETEEEESEDEIDVTLVNLKQRRGRCRPLCTAGCFCHTCYIIQFVIYLLIFPLWAKWLVTSPMPTKYWNQDFPPWPVIPSAAGRAIGAQEAFRPIEMTSIPSSPDSCNYSCVSSGALRRHAGNTEVAFEVGLTLNDPNLVDKNIHAVYPVLLASEDFQAWYVVGDRRHAYPMPFWSSKTKAPDGNYLYVTQACTQPPAKPKDVDEVLGGVYILACVTWQPDHFSELLDADTLTMERVGALCSSVGGVCGWSCGATIDSNRLPGCESDSRISVTSNSVAGLHTAANFQGKIQLQECMEGTKDGGCMTSPNSFQHWSCPQCKYDPNPVGSDMDFSLDEEASPQRIYTSLPQMKVTLQGVESPKGSEIFNQPRVVMLRSSVKETGVWKKLYMKDTGKFELPVAVDAPTKSPDDMMDEEGSTVFDAFTKQAMILRQPSRIDIAPSWCYGPQGPLYLVACAVNSTLYESTDFANFTAGQKVAPPPFNDRCVAVSGRCGSACDDGVVDMHRCTADGFIEQSALVAKILPQKNDSINVWLFVFLLLLGFAVKVAVFCPGIFRSYPHFRRYDPSLTEDLRFIVVCVTSTSENRALALRSLIGAVGALPAGCSCRYHVAYLDEGHRPEHKALWMKFCHILAAIPSGSFQTYEENVRQFFHVWVDQLRDPWALAEYLVTSDTRLVRAEFLWQLWRQRRSLPRRQEAEEETVTCNGHQLSALVTHREVESWAASVASRSRGSTSSTFIWAVSHCWEMREHPDPFRHQLQHLVNFTSLQHVAYEAQQWLFYDYLSVFQFQRSTGHEEESFRLALKKMHMFYSHACTRTLRIESLTPENAREDLVKSEEDLRVFHGPSGHLAHVPLSQSRTVQQHPPCSSPCCAFLHLNLVPFAQRGWCRVESEWSTMRGAPFGTRRIDEAEGRSVEMEEDGVDRERPDAELEFYHCKVAMPPEIFREQATSETLRFTHRSDLKAVMTLQKRVFLEKAANCEALIHERLPDRELQILAAGMHHYKSLVSLTLRRCYFEDEGAKRLGEALDSRLPLLHSLRCSECRGGDVLAQAAAVALRRCSLSQLVLAHDHIGVKGAEALADALQQNRQLTELVLDHNQLGPRGAEALGKALRRNQTLLHLDLAHNFIGYKGVEEFSKSLWLNQTLQRLLLPYNNIKDKGAEALALALPSSLQHLDLSSNDLRESAAEVLAASFKNLRRLDLGINRLGDAGAEALANALRGNDCLTHLDLSRNDLQRPSGEALADALRGNASLVHLDLASNELRQRGAEALIGALHENRTLRHLDLAENRVGFKVAEALAELHKVNEEVEVLLEYEAEASEATVHGVSDADDGGIRAPVRCKALASDLRSGAMLSALKLARNELNAEGIQVLADALSINSSVSSLCLEGAELGDAGIQVLSEALKMNHSIRILNLRDNLIGDPGIKALAGALKRNSSIRLLKLEINEIGDEGIKALALALKSNRALKTLFLGNNEIGDEGIKALAEALQENTSVNTLGIRGKNILRISSAAAPLYLVHNELGDDAIKALAEALKVNRSVSQLYLGDHDIGDEGIKALEALKDEKLRQGHRLVLEY